MVYPPRLFRVPCISQTKRQQIACTTSQCSTTALFLYFFNTFRAVPCNRTRGLQGSGGTGDFRPTLKSLADYMLSVG